MNNLFPLISLGNEAPLVVVADTPDLKPGQIALANEARFVTGSYSEALTQYIVGWKDTENIQATLDWIAPRVPVGRRFEYKKADNSEAFLSEVDDERAIGSAFKRVEYKGTTELAKTRNRGLTIRLDRDAIGGPINEERQIALLRQRMLRNALRRAFTVLLAAAHNTAVVWGANGTPDDDIADAVAAAQLSGGIFPNRGIIGLAALNMRRKSYGKQQVAAATAGLGLTATQIAQGAGLDDMRVSRELFQFSKTEKKRILESTFVAFSGQALLGEDDPSTAKRFVTPVGEGDIRVYRQEVGAKFIDLTVEGYDEIIGTSTVGVEKLTAAAA